MADTLIDNKITQQEADRAMRPLELDLTALFSIMQEDILTLVNESGIISPEQLIQAIDKTLTGEIDIKAAEVITKGLKETGEAITASIEPLLPRKIVYGNIPIRIEQEAGSMREGYDRDGNHWQTLFENEYGYFESTMGVDGDEVDVYLGEFLDTNMIYIIHQRDPVTGEYDEDKVMMFFQSPEEAKKTYQKHYDRPGMFGGITEVDINQFRRLLRDRKGSKLTSAGMGNGSDKDILINSLRNLKDLLNRKISY